MDYMQENIDLRLYYNFIWFFYSDAGSTFFHSQVFHSFFNPFTKLAPNHETTIFANINKQTMSWFLHKTQFIWCMIRTLVLPHNGVRHNIVNITFSKRLWNGRPLTRANPYYSHTQQKNTMGQNRVQITGYFQKHPNRTKSNSIFKQVPACKNLSHCLPHNTLYIRTSNISSTLNNESINIVLCNRALINLQ